MRAAPATSGFNFSPTDSEVSAHFLPSLSPSYSELRTLSRKVPSSRESEDRVHFLWPLFPLTIGSALSRIIPLYLIYRPANNIPYATLEEDLGKPLQTYCSRQWSCAGAPAASSSLEPVQKCQTFQHWLYQWTNGSFLVTDLAGTWVGDSQVSGEEAYREGRAQSMLSSSEHLFSCVFHEDFVSKVGQRPLCMPP